GCSENEKVPPPGFPWCRPSPRVTRRRDKLEATGVRTTTPGQLGGQKSCKVKQEIHPSSAKNFSLRANAPDKLGLKHTVGHLLRNRCSADEGTSAQGHHVVRVNRRLKCTANEPLVVDWCDMHHSRNGGLGEGGGQVCQLDGNETSPFEIPRA